MKKSSFDGGRGARGGGSGVGRWEGKAEVISSVETRTAKQTTMRTSTGKTLLRVLSAVAICSAMPSAPVYDQRQEGNTNVHAQLENVVVLFVPPAGMGIMNLVEMAAKSAGVGLKRNDPSPLAESSAQDAKFQRDPDYTQVPTDRLTPVENILNDVHQTERQTTQEPAKPTSTSDATDATQPPAVVAMDAVTAHSPKLALYSQFRSANPAQTAQHFRKHNRYNNYQNTHSR